MHIRGPQDYRSPLNASDRTASDLPLKAGDRLAAVVLEVEKGHDALIAFGQFKAYARLPLPVVSGQEIRLRVEQEGPGLRLMLLPQHGFRGSSQESPALPVERFEPLTEATPNALASKAFRAGEVVEGRITGFVKNERMLVDFGNFKAFVKIDIPVRVGQTLPLTVVETGDGINLSVVTKSAAAAPSPLSIDRGPSIGMPGGTIAPDASPSASSPPTTADMAQLREQIRQVLHASPSVPPEPASRALANLQALLRPVSPGGDGVNLMARIREFVERSGIYFEKRLETAIHRLQDPGTPKSAAELAAAPAIRELMDRDMKPNLLILKAFLDVHTPERPDTERPFLETLRSLVQRSLTHIDQQQTLAAEKPPDPDTLQSFSHLLMLADGENNARLKVYYRHKRRGQRDEPPRIALLLEMDRLGPVRTDLWRVGRDLNVTFFVQTEESRTVINDAKRQIHAALKGTFNTVCINVVVSEKKIEQFDGEDLTRSPQRQVDLSV